MGTEYATIFKCIPEQFRRHEKIYVMQYELSGIQPFLFGDVTKASTRESIGRRSAFVVTLTDRAERWLRERFSRFEAFRVLSKSSGKLICAVSARTRRQKIERVSDELQRIVFASAKGLELYYGVTKSEVLSESECASRQNAMSELANAVNRNKYRCTNLLGAAGGTDFRAQFAPAADEDEAQPKAPDGAMAAIKLDLDNLGSFFRKVPAFDTRKAASECLARVLDEAFRTVPGIDPVFVGGDDLFAVTKLETYLETVSALYCEIRRQVLTQDALTLYRDAFGVSGGVSIIRYDLGRVPLVYYYDESEEQLTLAKRVPGKNVLATPNGILTWAQLNALAAILNTRRDAIFRGTDAQQAYQLCTDVLRLKRRILDLHRNTGRTLLTPEEEAYVEHIR